MRRLCILIALFVGFFSALSAQLFQNDYMNRPDSSHSVGSLILDLQGSGWFYNNEYFNPFYKGYTLIGANFQPRLVYQSNPKLKFSAGAHLQRFYGDALKTAVKPLFSIEYSPRKDFSILMGSFNGGENHGLPEVLFSFENHLADIVENGVLINYKNSYIESETWLNWEQFIVPGDTFQEMFTAGSSNRLTILERSSWKLSLPLSMLAHHAGGQINNSDKPVETLINLSEGVKLTKFFASGSVENVFADVRVFHSLGDFAPFPGIALSVKSGVQTSHFELNAEYFKARDFMSFEGNPLFLSWEPTGDMLSPNRNGGSLEMLNFKVGFRQKMGENSFLFLRCEGYYIKGSNKLDYSYSLHFQVRDFLKLWTRL